MTRVAITTDRFAAAAPAFVNVGLEPVSLPCIRVEQVDDDVLIQVRQATLGADLLMVTSVRTLDLLWPLGSMPPVDVVAVGEATAAAVAERGGRVVVLGSSGLATLAERAADRLASSHVVFPHAAGSDPAALEALKVVTRQLVEYEVYRAIPVAPNGAPVQAAAFASPSAVAGWLLHRDLQDVVVGVIGPTTGRAVAQERPPDVTSPYPSHRALARAMASYLEASYMKGSV